MTRSPSFGPVIGVGTLARGSARTVSVTADAEARKAIAAALDLVDLRKLSLVGQLLPIGKADWRLEADLGALTRMSLVRRDERDVLHVDRFVAHLVTDRLRAQGMLA